MLPGARDQRPVRGQLALAAAKRLLVQGGRAQIPVNVAGADNAQGLQPVSPLNLYGHISS